MSTHEPSVPEQITESYQFTDYYEIHYPFGNAGIVKNPVTDEIQYHIMEPTLTINEMTTLQQIKDDIIKRNRIPLKILLDESKIEGFLRETVTNHLKRMGKKVPQESEDKYCYYIFRDFMGYGKLDLLLKDPAIEDISCNGINLPLYIWHRDYESLPTNIVYSSENELNGIISRLAFKAGQQISVARPIVEGTLPSGSRIHLTLNEVSKRGDTFTIRKFQQKPFTIIDLIQKGTISPKLGAYLWILVEYGRSVMISGATASGKTTFLNSICTFIRPELKVITIEDVRELRLHQNWVPMVSRQSFQKGVKEISLFDLLKSSLRQRPDYIIMGEVRGEEAKTLFQSIATGHSGFCTIHAESTESAIKRLVTDPMKVPELIVPLMNVMIQIRRMKVGDQVVRRVDRVSELFGNMPNGQPQIQSRFKWDSDTDDYIYLQPTGMENDTFRQISDMFHVPEEQLFYELKRREVILDWMTVTDKKTAPEVSELVRRYYSDPNEVYNMARFDSVDPSYY